jgi:hypothetical protein
MNEQIKVVGRIVEVTCSVAKENLRTGNVCISKKIQKDLTRDDIVTVKAVDEEGNHLGQKTFLPGRLFDNLVERNRLRDGKIIRKFHTVSYK